MKHLSETILLIVFVSTWVVGIVLSSGFWSCLFSIVIPPWGWYLVAEKILILNGII